MAGCDNDRGLAAGAAGARVEDCDTAADSVEPEPGRQQPDAFSGIDPPPGERQVRGLC